MSSASPPRTTAWRSELKLWITPRQAQRLLPQLRAMLQPDPKGDAEGRYRVTSLYLDSPDLRCYGQTRDGLAARVKYRLRYYGEQPERFVIEAKEKRGAMVRKHRGALPVLDQLPQQIQQASGVPATFLRGYLEGLVPRVWVGYRRTALVDTTTSLRVTLDEDLRATAPQGFALHGPMHALQLSRWRERRILELKYGRAMPAWLTDLLRPHGLFPESISKYELALGRLYLSRTDVSAWTH